MKMERRSYRILCGVLGILLGSLGIHKFLTGKIALGIVYIVLTLIGLGFIPCIVGIVEGIRYLIMSDYEFFKKIMNEDK